MKVQKLKYGVAFEENMKPSQISYTNIKVQKLKYGVTFGENMKLLQIIYQLDTEKYTDLIIQRTKTANII